MSCLRRNRSYNQISCHDSSEQSVRRAITRYKMAPTTPAIVPTKVSQNFKRKRGPTKLKNISADGESRIEVIFDDKGRPIRKGSVKLSSFLGLLVREIVPYTLSDWQNIPSGMAEVLWKSTQVRFKLDQEWERERVLKHMGVLWRASKSRLVTKINSTLNEEELMKLQPYNMKSLHDWQDFVKAKTSENFKVKSNGFKKMRKRQISHTMSRKGYARLADELKQKSKDPASINRVAVWTAGHTKKNGEPVKTNVDQTVEELKNVGRDTPNSSSANLKEYALSKVLGLERCGRERGLGILSQVSSQVAQLNEENAHFQSQMANMHNVIDKLKKNQSQNQQATNEVTPPTPIVPPSSVNTNPHSNKCKLLDWMGTGEVVAEGRWSSSDPNALVHHIPIGPNAMRVWVDVPKKFKVYYLWRNASDMTYIEEARGTTVAWPADKVILDSTTRSMA